MSWDVGCRCGSDLALLWLWLGGLVGPLAWEPLYALGVALKRPKKKKKKEGNSCPFDSHCLDLEAQQAAFVTHRLWGISHGPWMDELDLAHLASARDVRSGTCLG